MQITIVVPEMSCTKCGVKAPVQPRLLYLKAQTPIALRDVISEVMKEEKLGVCATDDANRVWEVIVDELPLGWAAGPCASTLCDKCLVMWSTAQKDFLMPAEPTTKPLTKVAVVSNSINPATPKNRILPAKTPTTCGVAVHPTLPL